MPFHCQQPIEKPVLKNFPMKCLFHPFPTGFSKRVRRKEDNIFLLCHRVLMVHAITKKRPTKYIALFQRPVNGVRLIVLRQHISLYYKP